MICLKLRYKAESTDMLNVQPVQMNADGTDRVGVCVGRAC